jgi:hypothetical protein
MGSFSTKTFAFVELVPSIFRVSQVVLKSAIAFSIHLVSPFSNSGKTYGEFNRHVMNDPKPRQHEIS